MTIDGLDGDGGPPPYVPATLSQVAAAGTRSMLVRSAVAGLLALALALGGAVAVGFAVAAAIPDTCTGDSCFGSPGLFGGLLAVPLTVYLGWAGALLVLRIRRPWLVALIAAPLTVILLVAYVAYSFTGSTAGGWAGQGSVLVLAALLAGPGAGLVAVATLLGRGRHRLALLPGVLIGIVLVVVLVSQVVIPLQRAATVTKFVPHTYRYDDPGLRLEFLSLNSYEGSLMLQYVTPSRDGRLVEVTEFRVPDGDLRVAAGRGCAPEVGSSPPACVRVAAPAPSLGVWRTNDSTTVVVLREDALLVVTPSDPSSDDQARTIADRLRPQSAAPLIRSAGSVSVYDFGDVSLTPGPGTGFVSPSP